MTLTKIASTGVEDSLRWVLGANGTSDYTFTGPGLTGTVNDPTIYLTRGHTYIFQNNSGGHPFYIKTSIANGGTNDAYNTGVTNNGGGNGTEIVFTVPHDSPDILYYQCSSHASMAGQFNIAGSVADGSISTAKIADDAVTDAKLANSINAAIAANTAKTTNATHTGDVTGSTSLTIADNAVTTAKIADEAVTLAKLEHGTSSNDGKFLRANNGADPTFETVNTDLVSDTSPQLGGSLDMNNRNITANDSSGGGNNRIVLGSGSDFQLWHDGSHSYIADEGTGNLRVQTNNLRIENAAGTENQAIFTENGAVELYYDNVKRFETTSTGTKWTGDLQTIDGGVLKLGTGNDLQIYHDGSNSYLDDTGTGILYAQGTTSTVLGVKHTGNNNVYINFEHTGHNQNYIGYEDDHFTVYTKNSGANTHSQRINVDASGLAFHGDTAAANRLNDYEEGTWTPKIKTYSNNTWVDASMDNNGTVNSAKYRKIGKIVHFHLNWNNFDIGSASYCVMGGLPFASANSGGGFVGITYTNAFANTNFNAGYIGGTSTLIEFYYAGNSWNGWLTSTQRYLNMAGTYLTDS